MRYETLGESGPEVPVLFLGCGNFGGIGSLPELFGRGDDQETAFAVMDAALAAGVHGYIIKSHSMDAMIGNLRHVLSGEIYVPPLLAESTRP